MFIKLLQPISHIWLLLLLSLYAKWLFNKKNFTTLTCSTMKKSNSKNLRLG